MVPAAAGRGAVAGAAGLGAALPFFAASFAASAAASSSAAARKCLRASSACSRSSELECVFFSVTPISGRYSIKTLALISSSRASSLILIWFESDIKLPSTSLQNSLFRTGFARFGFARLGRALAFASFRCVLVFDPSPSRCAFRFCGRGFIGRFRFRLG